MEDSEVAFANLFSLDIKSRWLSLRVQEDDAVLCKD